MIPLPQATTRPPRPAEHPHGRPRRRPVPLPRIAPGHLAGLVALGLFALLCLLPSPCLAAAPVTVHLLNGDRITGELIREDRQRVVIRSPVAGRITIPRDQIARQETLSATPPPVTPPLQDTATPGTNSPTTTQAPPRTATPDPATPPTASPPPPSPPARKSEDRLWSTHWMPAWLVPFTTNWHGNVGMGLNLGFGTTERQTFFVNANAAHSWERFVNAAGFNAAYGLVDDVEAANRMEGTLKTDVFVDRTRHLYAYNLAYGGYDKVRRIDRRLEEGIGMGYRIYDRNRLVVNIEGGGQFQAFDYTSQPDRSLWSIRFSESINWKPTDKFTVTQRLQYLPNIADFLDYRVRFDLVATYPLLKRLTVSLNLIEEYESRPAFGVDHNDLQITTNVNLTF